MEAEAGECMEHGAPEAKSSGSLPYPSTGAPHPGLPIAIGAAWFLQLAGHSGGGGSRDKNSPPSGRAGVPSQEVAGGRLTWQRSLGTGQSSWVEGGWGENGKPGG